MMRTTVCAAAVLCMLIAPAFGADAPDLTVRQNHLLFEFAEMEGKPWCWVQEIVVVINPGASEYSNPAGTVRFALPAGARDASPAPLPPIMPGSESTPELRPDEVTVGPAEIVVKRHLHPGKNSFSFQYRLPAVDGAVRIEKKILYQTHLLAAFAPAVEKLTSRTLTVEKAEDGYKILGQDLPAGTTLDLTFEGLAPALRRPAERRDGSAMATGMPAHTAAHPHAPAMSSYILPTAAGIILAVLVVLYSIQRRRAKESQDELRVLLMDELEGLDDALDKKEMTSEYHKRRKKVLMDRLRTRPPD